MKRTIFVLGIILFPLIGLADTIHVPGDQPTIQAGIDAAMDGDTVLVADGTYIGEGNRDIDFLGKAITVRSENGAENCIIDCEGSETDPHRGFFIHNGEGPDSVLIGFTVRNGYANEGGGIKCHSSPTLYNNKIIGNTASDWGGGGIFLAGGFPTINNCTISGNTGLIGGGIFGDWGLDPTMITNCTITGNISQGEGGGIYISNYSHLTITNCNISDNSGLTGGGIRCAHTGTGWPRLSVSITNCTIVGNTADFAGGLSYTSDSPNHSATIINAIIWGNQASHSPGINRYGLGEFRVTYSDVQGGWSGMGNLNTDPLLIEGPSGGYYLSQAPCQPGVDNPCVEAGDPASEMIWGTTRTDQVLDSGVVDMGFHYPGLERLVVGPGPAYTNPPIVGVFTPEQDAVHEYEFNAYGPMHYGVNVSCGDVDGDLRDEILTGAGPGEIYGPHVRGFAVNGTPLSGLSFLAYGTNKYGVNVAAGDLDGDGTDEIITGAGPGAVFGPHVRGWDYDTTGTVTAIPGVNFFAYGTPKWGVNVSCGDIDGDGFDEIVTGPGPGAVYGPHVRGWNVDGGSATAMPVVNFLAYGTNRMGGNVTCGDVDGDGIDEIVTGPGPSFLFGAHVRGWNCDGSAVTPMTSISFFAWSSEEVRFGANVFAGADLNGDGRSEIVVGAGPDPAVGTLVRVYHYDGSQISREDPWFSLEAFPGMTHGANVAGGRF